MPIANTYAHDGKDLIMEANTDLIKCPPMHPDTENNEMHDRCYLCGKKATSKYTFRIVNGGDSITLTPTAEEWDEDNGDMGFWNVGPECRKNLPAAAVVVSGK